MGNTKKTKKDLEREAEEKRKRDEEEFVSTFFVLPLSILTIREQKRVMAEFEADFARPSGPMSSRGRFVPGGGFVRAGGTSACDCQTCERADEEVLRLNSRRAGRLCLLDPRPSRTSPEGQRRCMAESAFALGSEVKLM